MNWSPRVIDEISKDTWKIATLVREVAKGERTPFDRMHSGTESKCLVRDVIMLCERAAVVVR